MAIHYNGGMNSLIVAILSAVGFVVAYRFYGAFLSHRIFDIDPKRITPAHEFEDGVDFVPTKKSILFGHHFTSIAGCGPIVGPAIAVIWGWVPALLWVVFGSIFMGAVHDFGALVVSARNKGRTIGDITRDLIGERARRLFLLLIFFSLLIVLAVFGLIMAVLFKDYPATVLPVWFEIPIAVALGYFIYKKSGNSFLASIVALITMYGFVYLGVLYPIELPAFFMDNLVLSWVILLFIYAYVASVLPVWVLLQPRDYINSHQLFVGLGLMYLGLLIGTPEIVAPAINLNPEGAPSIIPFLFITVACGAISGFHSLVSSGTTVKQLDKEEDMQSLGYGSMILEGFLATLVILTCTAGFATQTEWFNHYASWNSANGLGAKIGAFIEGGAGFLAYVGISHEIGVAIIAVLVISFAATTLDSATRIQRFIVQEIASDFKNEFFKKKHGATIVAIGTAFALASINGGKGGMIMWPLFGTVNQLLAGLGLIAISVYLYRLNKPVVYTMAPMVVILIMTSWAMVINLQTFIGGGKWLLVTFGILIIILEVWLIIEAALVLKHIKKHEPVN